MNRFDRDQAAKYQRSAAMYVAMAAYARVAAEPLNALDKATIHRRVAEYQQMAAIHTRVARLIMGMPA